MSSDISQVDRITARKSFLYAFICLAIYFLQALLQGLFNGGSFQLSEDTGRLFSYFATMFFIGILMLKKNKILSYAVGSAGINRIRPGIYVLLLIIPAQNILQIVNSPADEVNVLVCIVSGIYIGIIEELIFRGFLLQGLLQKLSRSKAVLISSVIFGLFHLVNIGSYPLIYVLLQVIYAAAIGVCFAIITITTGTLLPGILLHALVDILGDFVLEASWQLDLFAAVVCVIMAICFFRNKNMKREV